MFIVRVISSSLSKNRPFRSRDHENAFSKSLESVISMVLSENECLMFRVKSFCQVINKTIAYKIKFETKKARPFSQLG